MGKVRHLGVRELLLQEWVRRGDMALGKVPGAKTKLSDILSKHVPGSCWDKHLIAIGDVRASVRHPLNPRLWWGEGVGSLVGVTSSTALIGVTDEYVHFRSHCLPNKELAANFGDLHGAVPERCRPLLQARLAREKFVVERLVETAAIGVQDQMQRAPGIN